MASVRVLIADDHLVVREGTRKILERDPGLAVVGETADGHAVLAQAQRLAPDVVLMDLSLPGITGIEATRRLRSSPGAPRVLILSVHDEEDYVVAAIEAGAAGYLSKDADAAELIAAIHAVADGAMVFHPQVATHLLARSRRAEPPPDLSRRELEILRLAADGKRSHEIARDLSVSLRTVEAGLSSVYAKLGVSSRAEAVATAIARGWIHLDGDAS